MSEVSSVRAVMVKLLSWLAMPSWDARQSIPGKATGGMHCSVVQQRQWPNCARQQKRARLWGIFNRSLKRIAECRFPRL
jgi:hypothetical protein